MDKQLKKKQMTNSKDIISEALNNLGFGAWNLKIGI